MTNKRFMNSVLHCLYRFTLLFLSLFIIIPLYSSDSSSNGYKLIGIKRTNDDVGLSLEEKYYYQKPFYSDNYLPSKVISNYTDRLFLKHKIEHEIIYDNLNNPIRIEKIDSDGKILKKIHYEYDNKLKAIYPYPTKDLFPFLNLKPDKRVMMKTIIDYEKSTKTFQKLEYRNTYLTTIMEYSRERKLIRTIEYHYEGEILRRRTVKSPDGIIQSANRYLYYEKQNKYTLGCILYSEKYPYISSFGKITSLLDGSIRIERGFKPLSEMKLSDFTPYTKGREYALIDYRYKHFR